MSSVVRIPDDVAVQVKQIAAMQGTVPGEVLARAWQEFFEIHRQELAADFATAAKAVRKGDVETMAAMLNRGNRERAARAASAARSAGRAKSRTARR